MSRFHDIDRSFNWLGRFPLAVDLADTVRMVADEEMELLDDEQALVSWIDAESARFSHVHAARDRINQVRELRDVVRKLLAAHVTGRALPEVELELLNEASARSPSFPMLTTSGGRATIETSDNPFDVFAAEVARSAISLISEKTSDIQICRAPRCGMFFVRTSPRQRWCSPACGNRARVARHAARTNPEQKA